MSWQQALEEFWWKENLEFDIADVCVWLGRASGRDLFRILQSLMHPASLDYLNTQERRTVLSYLRNYGMLSSKVGEQDRGPVVRAIAINHVLYRAPVEITETLEQEKAREREEGREFARRRMSWFVDPSSIDFSSFEQQRMHVGIDTEAVRGGRGPVPSEVRVETTVHQDETPTQRVIRQRRESGNTLRDAMLPRFEREHQRR